MRKLARSMHGLICGVCAVLLGCSADPDGMSRNTVKGGSGGSAVPQGGSAASYGGAGGGLMPGSPGSAGAGGGAAASTVDPKTCEEAAATRSYVGCDYWPTETYNNTYGIFDFTVVVSNPGSTPAEVTLTGPQGVNQSVTVMPGLIEKIYLPWIPELKGPDAQPKNDEVTSGIGSPLLPSVLVAGGAFHLVSSVPVLVYQFSPLEAQGKGGPPDKNWALCPINTGATGCYSYTNDASLLLPSTAMTGNYRVVTIRAAHERATAFGSYAIQTFIAITATQDQTRVVVQLSPSGEVLAGAGIAEMAAGTAAAFMMNTGDVLQLVGPRKLTSDQSGSLVQADKPIQVIAGAPYGFAEMDDALHTCNHLEESMMPAETLGKQYAVSIPTGEKGTPRKTFVRFVGNVDGTQLTYAPPLAGAPATLNAGEVVEVPGVTMDFVVTGDQPFVVATIQPSAFPEDRLNGDLLMFPKGDPAMSVATAIEQHRSRYVFLAPDDYDVSYADVVAPATAMLVLDFMPVAVTPTPIEGTDYVVYRIPLTSGNAGGHTLEADQPFGLQVIGHSIYTGYQYPGGLNLLSIAAPPPPIALE